ncbi:MAG: VOC family protein [Negativicutes bacterium]|nr:VOC family protein [Negativicutes bacterium]
MKMPVPLEIGLVVNNMERMVDYYVNVLGLTLVGDSTGGAEASTRVSTTPHGYRIVRLQTPSPSGERIKFVMTNKEAAQPAPVPQWVYERHGICYLTFVVTNLNEIVQRLKEKGVKLMNPEVVEVRPGMFCINSTDPEGNFVEFVEYTDVQSYRPELFK